MAGRRLIRWVNHAPIILLGASPDQSRMFFRSLSQQVRFLAKRARAASPGLPRIEALAGQIYAGLALEGLDRGLGKAERVLEQECLLKIDGTGAIASRAPEDLLDVFSLLTWVIEALENAGRTPGSELKEAVARIAPTLRALRHTDGSLARFHGGDAGVEGRLDQALLASGVRKIRSDAQAMGYVRLSHGRTSLIMDAAAPPEGVASARAHASTLAFELTSGRRPLIVNCGSGASFGEKWRRAGRATASHSTLSIDGFSSARLGATRCPRALRPKF